MPEEVSLEKENEGMSERSWFFNVWSEFYQLTHRSDTTNTYKCQSKKEAQTTSAFSYRNVNVLQRNVDVVL